MVVQGPPTRMVGKPQPKKRRDGLIYMHSGKTSHVAMLKQHCRLGVGVTASGLGARGDPGSWVVSAPPFKVWGLPTLSSGSILDDRHLFFNLQ